MAARRAGAGILAVVAALAVATGALADGQPDRSFSGDGRNSVDLIPGFQESPQDMAIDSKGRIVVAGIGFSSIQANVAFVARFLPNGSLDPGFNGGSGFAIVALEPGEEVFFGVTVDGRDRVIAAGSAGGDAFVARRRADGTIDDSFDFDGEQTIDIGGGSDRARAVALDRQGRIVLAGSTTFSGGDIALLRLTPNGDPDLSLLDQGFALPDVGGIGSSATAISVLPNGRILLGGTVVNSFNADFLAARIRPNGSLDRGFSSNGFATVDLGANGDAVGDLARDRRGRIVLAGQVGDSNGKRTGIVRLSPAGALDRSFRGDGRAFASSGLKFEGASKVGIDRGGRIVIAGTGGEATNDALLARPPLRWQPRQPGRHRPARRPPRYGEAGRDRRPAGRRPDPGARRQ